MWGGRVGQVSVSGTSVMVSGSAERWFGPGFLDRSPDTASRLLHALQETDDQGYIQVCQALADFDVRDRLDQIAAPVLAVAGSPTSRRRRRTSRDRRERHRTAGWSSSTGSRTWPPPRRLTWSPG